MVGTGQLDFEQTHSQMGPALGEDPRWTVKPAMRDDHSLARPDEVVDRLLGLDSRVWSSRVMHHDVKAGQGPRGETGGRLANVNLESPVASRACRRNGVVERQS